MLSSGEAPITSFSQDGGTRARVLALWGSSFGDTTQEIGQILNGVNEGILENYGHALPQFIQFLISRQADWPRWQEHFRRLRQRFQRRAGSNAVAGRMAEHFAALRMTAILAHRAFSLPWAYRDLVSELWEQLVAETPEADRAAVALRYALSWAESHREEFHGQRSGGHGAPSQRWAGRWDAGAWENHNGDAFLGFLPHKLDQVLKDGGFEPEPIRRLWQDRGWLRVTQGRSVYRARMSGASPAYLVAIEATAIRQALGEDVANGPQPPLAPRGSVGRAAGREQSGESENRLRTP